MQGVDCITCINKGGYVMRFRVEWSNGGVSGWTNDYHVNQSASLNLNNFTIPDGGEVKVEVSAVAGEKKHSHQTVVFTPNIGATARYVATGTTFDIHVDLEDIDPEAGCPNQ